MIDTGLRRFWRLRARWHTKAITGPLGKNTLDWRPGLFAESKIIGKLILVLPLSHLYTAYGFTLAIVFPFSLTVHRSREGRTPMRDRMTLLIFAIMIVSVCLTISHYFLNVNAI